MNMEVRKVLREEISEDNVLQISEYIALKATKYMIGWAGYPMAGLYKVLYINILLILLTEFVNIKIEVCR